MVENIIEILKVNWRQNLRYHTIAAILFCGVTPFFFDVRGLDAPSTAKILEIYLILLGIICLVPVFLPDQDLAIRDLLDTKRMPACGICAVRLLESLAILAVLVAAMLLYLAHEGCTFSFGSYFAGAIAGMLFLGSIGMAVFALTNMMPLAYMAPMLYYIINMGSGKKYLGNWYLNSMCEGSFVEKWYLFLTGAALIGFSLFCRMYVGKGNTIGSKIGSRFWNKRDLS